MSYNIGHNYQQNILEKMELINRIKSKRSTNFPVISVESVIHAGNFKYLSALPSILANVGVSKILISNLLPIIKDLEPLAIYSSLSKTDINQIITKFREECARYNINYVLPRFDFTAERHCGFIEDKATVIRWDGNVVPCYRFLHDHKEIVLGRAIDVKNVSFGNILEYPLFDIWNSEKYREFRFRVKNFMFPSCIHCDYFAICPFAQTSERDCWGNTPSCSNCLWAHRLIQCP